MTELDSKQKKQEEEYFLPYHFIDIGSFKEVIYKSYLDTVVSILNPSKDDKILDAGCGDGRLIYEIRDSNAELVGVDYSERAIAFAKIFSPKVPFYIEDLTKKTHFKSGSFNKIVSIETLEHIHPTKIDLFLSELKRLSKKEGTIIITVPSINLPLLEKHYQHFNEELVNKIIGKYFKIIKIIGFHNKSRIFNFVFYLLRYPMLVIDPINKFNKLKLSYSNFISNFFQKYLLKTSPNNALALMVVCKNE